MRTSIDYDDRQWSVYAKGRAMTPARARLWQRVFGRYLSPETATTVLDLGSGAGIYSAFLAEVFGAEVVGVEPSARMRAVAEREHGHRGVRYVEGSAEQIHLRDASCDLALLSCVIHHVRDRGRCAQELRRVLRDGGLVLIRGTLRESLPGMPLFDFFPTARSVAERQLPSGSEVIETFTRHGFELSSSETLQQETAASLSAYVDRIELRAVSTLELISDAHFDDGLGRLREAARLEAPPRPVVEPTELLVFRRAGPAPLREEGKHGA